MGGTYPQPTFTRSLGGMRDPPMLPTSAVMAATAAHAGTGGGMEHMGHSAGRWLGRRRKGNRQRGRRQQQQQQQQQQRVYGVFVKHEKV